MYKSILTFVFCAMCLTISTVAHANDNSGANSENPQHKMVFSSCSK